jgi:hypothetical protein
VSVSHKLTGSGRISMSIIGYGVLSTIVTWITSYVFPLLLECSIPVSKHQWRNGGQTEGFIPIYASGDGLLNTNFLVPPHKSDEILIRVEVQTDEKQLDNRVAFVLLPRDDRAMRGALFVCRCGGEVGVHW